SSASVACANNRVGTDGPGSWSSNVRVNLPDFRAVVVSTCYDYWLQFHKVLNIRRSESNSFRCTLAEKATLSGLALAKIPLMGLIAHTEYAKARYIRSKARRDACAGLWLLSGSVSTRQ